ncbi:putative aspartate aminotransferase [Streptomyces antimycoticus]
MPSTARRRCAGCTDIARRHQLIVCSDEIYDKILYDGATHTPTTTVAPDLLTLTFNGLSKAYRVAGYRSGWSRSAAPRRTPPAIWRG